MIEHKTIDPEVGVMSALEWLDAVRADLDAASYQMSIAYDHRSDRWFLGVDEPTRDVLRHSQDRLDRMERALRAVLHLDEAVNAAAIIPTSTPIMNAGYRAALGDVVTAIEEVLA